MIFCVFGRGLRIDKVFTWLRRETTKINTLLCKVYPTIKFQVLCEIQGKSENHPIEKRTSSSIHLHLWVPAVNFPGCNPTCFKPSDSMQDWHVVSFTWGNVLVHHQMQLKLSSKPLTIKGLAFVVVSWCCCKQGRCGCGSIVGLPGTCVVFFWGGRALPSIWVYCKEVQKLVVDLIFVRWLLAL